MPTPALAIEDDGFIVVTINGEAKQVDSYAAYHRLLALHDAVRDERPDGSPAAAEGEYLKRVAAYLGDELGYGAVSTRAAEKFAGAIFGAVEGQKKTDSPAPTPA